MGKDIVELFFSDEDIQVKAIEVLLRPEVQIHLLKHGKTQTVGASDIVAPSAAAAPLNREGFLFPTSPITTPRDLLEPLPKDTFPIGEMTEYGKYRTAYDSITFGPGNEDELREEIGEQRMGRYARYQQRWQKYLKDSDELLKHIVGKWLASPKQHKKTGYSYIAKANQPGRASTRIPPIYNHLSACKKGVSLLTCFASKEKPSAEPLLASSAMFSERLGHPGDKFPLAVAQRDALSHYLTQQPSDTLVVNDPPDTRKTTLVLSIITTEWTRVALNKAEPPVVVATSTSNQAVTNIVETFDKDFSISTGPMAGR